MYHINLYLHVNICNSPFFWFIHSPIHSPFNTGQEVPPQQWPMRYRGLGIVMVNFILYWAGGNFGEHKIWSNVILYVAIRVFGG